MANDSSIPKLVLPGSEATGSDSGRQKIRSGFGIGRWLSHINSGAYKELQAGTRLIAREELASHCKPTDMWMALPSSGQLAVYDVSPFAAYHPGGLDVLLENSGMDASEAFRMAHSYVNVNMISKLRKGFLASGPPGSCGRTSLSPRMIQPASFLSNKKKPSWQWHQHQQTDSGRGTPGIALCIAVPEQRRTGQLSSLELGAYRTLVVWRPPSELSIRVLLDTGAYYCLDFRLLSCLTPQMVTLRSTPTNVPEKVKAGPESDLPPTATAPLSVSLDLAIQPEPECPAESVAASESRCLSTIGSVSCDQLMSFSEALDSPDKEFLSCRVLESKRVENTRFRFLKLAWPEDKAWIPIPLGHHVIVRVCQDKSGDSVCRPYTPVCSSTRLDSSVVAQLPTGACLSLLVKVYPDGQMSPLLDRLSVGDAVDVSLPMGKCPVDFFAASGRSPEALFILAAGSGITPMLRPLAAALFPAGRAQSSALTSVHMICFDRDRSDQVLVGELRELSKRLPDRFSVLHVLSHPREPVSPTDGFVEGRVGEGICSQGLFTLQLQGLKPDGVGDRALWLICGPRGFNEAAVRIAHTWGVPGNCLVVFSG